MIQYDNPKLSFDNPFMVYVCYGKPVCVMMQYMLDLIDV